MLNPHFLNKKVILGILLQLLLLYSTLQYTMYLKLILHQNFPHFPFYAEAIKAAFCHCNKKGSFSLLLLLMSTTYDYKIAPGAKGAVELLLSYYTNCTLHYIRWHLECNFPTYKCRFTTVATNAFTTLMLSSRQ